MLQKQITALTLSLVLTAHSQPLNLPEIFQLYNKPYIIAPTRPPDITYITKTGKTTNITATHTTLPNNKTISTAEQSHTPTEEIIAQIETDIPPQEITLDIDTSNPPPFETLLEILKHHAIIKPQGKHYIIHQIARLHTPDGKEETGTYQELYARAIDLKARHQPPPPTLLYPTITTADFLVLCQTVKAQCYPLSSAVLVVAEENKLKELQPYAKKQRPRYRIKSIIAQLTENAKKELSLDLNLKLSQTSTQPLIQIESNLTETNAQIQTGKINALILKLKAQESQGKAVILSNPEILTDDRETAQISTGYQVPVITPATPTSPATTTFKDAVLSLTVEPLTLPDGKIQLNITLTKDNPDFSKELNGNIPITTNTIKTTITTQKGQLIAIGGITEESQAKTKTAPDIPILKNIFGSRQTSQEKKELYIFLTIDEE